MKGSLGYVAVLLLLLTAAPVVAADVPSPSGYTFYLIQITIFNTAVMYHWTVSNPCGVFTAGGQAQPDSAIWNFTAGVGTQCTGVDGPSGTITAVMTDTQGESITCTYPDGSANFNGTAASDCSAVNTPNFTAQPQQGFGISGVLAYLVLSGASTSTTSTTTTTTTTKGQTSTQVACSPKNVTVSAQSKCIAAVFGNSPTGLVQWGFTSTNGGSITFPSPYNSRVCVLSNGACFVMVTGNITGVVSIQAAYQGDDNNLPSGGSTTLGINSGATSTTTTSSSTTSTSATGGIPELPIQPTFLSVLTAIVVLAYLFARSRASLSIHK